MTNCANIVQTETNEASTFLNKGACSITITSDENIWVYQPKLRMMRSSSYIFKVFSGRNPPLPPTTPLKL